jgi:hypothetical protein
MELSIVRRDTLLAEVVRLKDFGACFDLRAFPLPLRVGPHERAAGLCFSCRHDALHIYMRILPRSDQELAGLPRDELGQIELNTCTGVTQALLDSDRKKAVDKVRVAIKNMVLHEVYEALLFRGMRIMDPHDHFLQPADQPF